MSLLVKNNIPPLVNYKCSIIKLHWNTNTNRWVDNPWINNRCHMMKPILGDICSVCLLVFLIFVVLKVIRLVLNDESSFWRHSKPASSYHTSKATPSPPHLILNGGQLAAHPAPEILKVWQCADISVASHKTPGAHRATLYYGRGERQRDLLSSRESRRRELSKSEEPNG